MRRGRRPSYVPKEQVEAKKMYLNGMLKEVIAEKLGVSLMTIYRWAKKGNWERRYSKEYERKLKKIYSFEQQFLRKSYRKPKYDKI